jgi:hypothetical protein
MLFAIALIAVALAIGALVGSSGGTTAPARTANENAAVDAPAGADSGLIKGGLQPRPYSPIVVDEPAVGGEAPDGFVRMPGGEVRPTSGS